MNEINVSLLQDATLEYLARNADHKGAEAELAARAIASERFWATLDEVDPEDLVIETPEGYEVGGLFLTDLTVARETAAWLVKEQKTYDAYKADGLTVEATCTYCGEAFLPNDRDDLGHRPDGKVHGLGIVSGGWK